MMPADGRTRALTTLPGTKYVCPFCKGRGKSRQTGDDCSVCQKLKQPIFRAVFTEHDGSTTSMLVVGKNGKRLIEARFKLKAGVKVTFEPYKEA